MGLFDLPRLAGIGLRKQVVMRSVADVYNREKRNGIVAFVKGLGFPRGARPSGPAKHISVPKPQSEISSIGYLLS